VPAFLHPGTGNGWSTMNYVTRVIDVIQTQLLQMDSFDSSALNTASSCLHIENKPILSISHLLSNLTK
jgi:hypothetical protein